MSFLVGHAEPVVTVSVTVVVVAASVLKQVKERLVSCFISVKGRLM